MVLTYGVVAEYGAGAPRRRPSVASSPSRNRARSVPSKASTESSASSHSLVSTGSTSFRMAIVHPRPGWSPSPLRALPADLSSRSFHQPTAGTSLDLSTPPAPGRTQSPLPGDARPAGPAPPPRHGFRLGGSDHRGAGGAGRHRHAAGPPARPGG